MATEFKHAFTWVYNCSHEKTSPMLSPWLSAVVEKEPPTHAHNSGGSVRQVVDRPCDKCKLIHCLARSKIAPASPTCSFEDVIREWKSIEALDSSNNTTTTQVWELKVILIGMAAMGIENLRRRLLFEIPNYQKAISGALDKLDSVYDTIEAASAKPNAAKEIRDAVATFRVVCRCVLVLGETKNVMLALLAKTESCWHDNPQE